MKKTNKIKALLLIPTFLLLSACSEKAINSLLDSAIKGLLSGVPDFDGELSGEAEDFINALTGNTDTLEKSAMDGKIMSANMGEAHKTDLAETDMTAETGMGQPYIMADKKKNILMVGAKDRELRFTPKDYQDIDGEDFGIFSFKNKDGEFRIIPGHFTKDVFVAVSNKKGSYPDFYLKNKSVISLEGEKPYYVFPITDGLHEGVEAEEVKYQYATEDENASPAEQTGQRVLYKGYVLASDLKDKDSAILDGESDIWLTYDESSKNIISEVKLNFASETFIGSSFHNLSSRKALILNSTDDDDMTKVDEKNFAWTSTTKAATGDRDKSPRFEYEMFVNGRDFGDYKNVPVALLGRFNVETTTKYYAGVFSGALASPNDPSAPEENKRALAQMFEGGSAEEKKNDCIGTELGLETAPDGTDC